MDGELRRHAHAVWCRIDPETMTAKQLSFDREKLREVSRELHIKHDLEMPPGLQNSKDRDPRNFTLEEWQQCKRAEKNPKQVKEVFQDCWSASDSRQAFANALQEQGYILAQGRRGHMAVDFKGEKYPVHRYVGNKAKDVRARFGDPEGLPSIDAAQKIAAQQITNRLQELKLEQEQELQTKREHEAAEQKRLRDAQAKEAQQLKEEQTKRQQEEEQTRQSRIRGGLWGIWDRVTGKRKETERQNEQEAIQAQLRDVQQSLRLMEEQNRLQQAQREKAKAEQRVHERVSEELQADIEWLEPEPSRVPDKTEKTYTEQQREMAAQVEQDRIESPAQPTTDQELLSYAEQQRLEAQDTPQHHSRDGPELEH